MSRSRKITAGVDIGSTTSKAVMLIDGQVASFVIGPITVNPIKTARQVYLEALNGAGVYHNQVSYIAGTGYGGANVDFAHEIVPEISCHARGTHHLLPEARTIVDIGGRDTKAISINQYGGIRKFAVNDKCAAGTGRFLDFMAMSMGLEIEDMVRLHFEEGPPAIIRSACSIFAESEVTNLVNEEIPLPCIVKGLNRSMAKRLIILARSVGVEKEIVVTGGGAKNRGLVETLEEGLKQAIISFPSGVDPQIIGALGAAVIASGGSQEVPGTGMVAEG